MLRTLRTAVLPAVVGGVIVAAAFVLADPAWDAGTRTVIAQAPIGAAPTAADPAPTPNAVYRRAARGVVFVRSELVQDVQSPFDLVPERQRSEATGSGFVIDRTGRILTNYHVVAGASAVTVSFADKRPLPVRIVGTDPSKDLALLKLDPRRHRGTPLPLGDSSRLQVGDAVLALGNPFGFDRTLTSGIVSALQRQIEAPNGFTIDDVIQTDAAINPGNSGGPLLDATGRVIGITSQIATGGSGDGNVGIGFAVPIDTAKRDLHGLETKGRIERPWIGVAGSTAGGGVLVQEVVAGSPADRAGLRGGEIVTQIDGKPVGGIDELTQAIGKRSPGDRVTLTVKRGGAVQRVTVTLAPAPTRAAPSTGTG